MEGIKNTKGSFFPESLEAKKLKAKQTQQALLKRNTPERQGELKEALNKDAKVNISREVKDFSRMKKLVDQAPDLSLDPERSAKIADIKSRIQNGSYEVDYEALADRLLKSEL